MQTIQLKVNDNSLNLVMNLLNNLKKEIINEIIILDKNETTLEKPKTEEQIKLDKVKGILKNRISNPLEYQKKLRDEWNRD